MARRIDYYFTLLSPWAYIGDALFKATARKHGAAIDYRPVDYMKLFPASGGLALPQRHPLRQRYRVVELQRWRERRGLKFALQPKNWPFDPTLADCCVIALAEAGIDPARYTSKVAKAIFEEERSLAKPEELAVVLRACGADADAILARAQSEAVKQVYAGNHDRALAAGVFGAPSYALDGEVFWGQDRLELLDDALTSGRAPYKPD